METSTVTESSQSPEASQESPATSQPALDVSAERKQLQATLAEARATRDMLVNGRAAVESGTFNGNRMLALAQFMAFIEAILKQNNAHIQNLQEKL